NFMGVSSLEEARTLDGEFVREKLLEYQVFWGPVVDHKFVMGNVFELFMENKRLRVPVLLGQTSSEFFGTPEVSSLDEFKGMAEKLFGADASEFLKLCDFESGDLEAMKKKAAVPTIEYAIRVLGKANNDTGFDMPLYYYNFDPEIPGWDNPGTFHSADLWFFFETLAKCWRPFVGKHYDLAREMSNYLANFITAGNPNGEDVTGEKMPQWDPYTVDAPYGMVFGDKSEFVKEQPSELMHFLVNQYFKAN
uniref:carboxylesterase family protein n=1 Tax=Jeotgalibaca porci TaxID=1868793 RepID=UPI0035A1C0A3